MTVSWTAAATRCAVLVEHAQALDRLLAPGVLDGHRCVRREGPHPRDVGHAEHGPVAAAYHGEAREHLVARVHGHEQRGSGVGRPARRPEHARSVEESARSCGSRSRITVPAIDESRGTLLPSSSVANRHRRRRASPTTRRRRSARSARRSRRQRARACAVMVRKVASSSWPSRSSIEIWFMAARSAAFVFDRDLGPAPHGGVP